MKKILSIVLALVLVLSLSTAALAVDNQDASFSKTYKITNEGTSNPAETFTFEFEADRVTDSPANVQKANMPAIPDSTIDFTAGTATAAGLQKTVAVALDNVTWPSVGVYYYKVTEKTGTTAGVLYSTDTAYLKVTVAYDQGTNTYYTAFVTLSLADEDNNGQTDVKTGGFTNEYQAGSLSISKSVTGNMGDQNAYFAVTVTLTGDTTKTYLESYAVSGGSYEQNPTTISVNAENGTVFYLKHGETITISNLPYGVTYTVVEDDYTAAEKGGYEAASYKWSDETNKKIDSPSDTVEITNAKSTGVDMGVSVDSLPYILMLAVACIGLVVFFTKKRAAREN